MDETGTETGPNYKRHPAAVAHGPNLSKFCMQIDRHPNNRFGIWYGKSIN